MPVNDVATGQDNSFVGGMGLKPTPPPSLLDKFESGLAHFSIADFVTNAATGQLTAAQLDDEAKQAAASVARAGGNSVEQQAAYNEVYNAGTGYNEANNFSFPSIPGFSLPSLTDLLSPSTAGSDGSSPLNSLAGIVGLLFIGGIVVWLVRK